MKNIEKNDLSKILEYMDQKFEEQSRKLNNKIKTLEENITKNFNDKLQEQSQVQSTELNDKIKTLEENITKNIDNQINDLKRTLDKQKYQIAMLSENISSPKTFQEALSPAAIINGKKRYINPAYEE